MSKFVVRLSVVAGWPTDAGKISNGPSKDKTSSLPNNAISLRFASAG